MKLRCGGGAKTAVRGMAEVRHTPQNGFRADKTPGMRGLTTMQVRYHAGPRFCGVRVQPGALSKAPILVCALTRTDPKEGLVHRM